jgi:hypothetical protein
MFDFFTLSSRAYARRTETMLREARFAQLEHEAAAEHHHALANMYADRVLRLEAAQRAARAPEVSLPGEAPLAELQRAERALLRVRTPQSASAQQAAG